MSIEEAAAVCVDFTVGYSKHDGFYWVRSGIVTMHAPTFEEALLRTAELILEIHQEAVKDLCRGRS